MHWILNGIAVTLVSILVTGIIIPQILLIAFRKKLFDEPDERKIHTAAVPRLGGLAFMPSIVFSLCLVLGFDLMTDHRGLAELFLPFTDGMATECSRLFEGAAVPLCFGLAGVMIMYLVGIADDLIGVRYRAKFVAQIMAALLLVAGGATLTNLHGFMGFEQIPSVAGAMLTLLLVVFITNAINLIDGIDGLASGLSAIAMGFYAINFMMAGEWIYALVACAGVGTLVPFFYYNVFGNATTGKKIFMGDTGSLTTGFLLAFLAFETANLPSEHLGNINILVIAYAPLAVPCLDVVRVFTHRLMRGRSPFLPDKSHIHHKLLALGIPQRRAMLLIVCFSAMLVTVNLWMSKYCGPFVILLFDLAFWVVGNMLLSRAISARCRRLGLPMPEYKA